MTVIRTALAYLGVILVAYFPIILSGIEPFKSYIESAEEIVLISISIVSVFYIFSIVLLLVGLISLHEVFESNYKYSLITLITILGSISLIVYGTLSEGTISIIFLPNLIPSLISASIGVIGTFSISCFLRPFCENEPKFQRQKIMLPLRNS